MKKQKLLRALSITLFCTVLLAPTVVYAKSYKGLEYHVKLYLEGKSREYSAGTIKIRAYNCSQDCGSNHAASKNFTVKLYQDHFWSNPYIGSQKLSRTSGGTIKWEHMAKDDYFITIEKASDGCKINGTIDITQ